MYSRVDPHPSCAIFSDDIYLDSAGCSLSFVLVHGRRHAVYGDGMTRMDEFVPYGNEVRCIGRWRRRVGVFPEKLLDHVNVERRERRGLYVYIAIAFDFVAEESEAREGVLVVWRCGVDNGQVWEGKIKRLYGLIDLG